MIGSVVYIPPPSFKGAKTFVENLLKFPPRHQLIMISDHDYKNVLPKANHVTLMTSPENFAGRARNPTSGISNAMFVVCMREVRKRNLKHVLYVESDCRFGRLSWDATIFREYFEIGFPVIAAGTLMAWNVFNGGSEWVKRFRNVMQKTQDFPVPVHAYGIFPIEGKPFNPTLFPNGAGSVLNVDWMFELFDDFENMMAIALGDGCEGKAWDWQVGERARKRFGAQSWDMFAHLRSVCSTYGDLSMTEDERLALLKEGVVQLSHQHKGDKTI